MGHELTNLFILAGSLFLLFIGYLAYQLASTEKGTRNQCHLVKNGLTV